MALRETRPAANPVEATSHERHEALNDEAPRTVASRSGFEPVLFLAEVAEVRQQSASE
jgi:hypothetical protein